MGTFAELPSVASGNEPANPKNVAEVIAALANRPDAPLRLLLGTDAVQ